VTTEFVSVIREMKETDSVVCVLRKWLDQGEKPSFDRIQGYGMIVKSLWSQFEKLLVEDNVLYRKWTDGKSQVTSQAIVQDTKLLLLARSASRHQKILSRL